MNLKNQLLDIALLGTDKKKIAKTDIPQALHPFTEPVMAEKQDEESLFLNVAGLVHSYYKSGIRPLVLNLPVPKSEEESLPLCSEKAVKVLKKCMDKKYNRLILHWTKLCRLKKQRLPGYLMPAYLYWLGTQKGNLPPDFQEIIGKKGIWLSQQNPEWKWITGQNKAEYTDWKLAPFKEILNILEERRIEEPEKAFEMIQSIWKEENANNRLELLHILEHGISQKEEAFLLENRTQKSRKVFDKINDLLLLLPDTDIAKQYQKVLRDSIFWVETKKLMVKKLSLKVDLKVEEESLYKNGIERMSSDKKIKDDDYVLMQLIAQVNPDFWMAHLDLTREEVLNLFLQDKTLKNFQHYLLQAIYKFRNPEWAKAAIQQFPKPPSFLLECIPAKERVHYAEKMLSETDLMINYLIVEEQVEWEIEFSKKLIHKTAENPSLYNLAFFEKIILFLPEASEAELDKVKITEGWKLNTWEKQKPEIKNLYQLKKQLNEALI